MRSPKTAAKTIYDRARIFASMPVVIAIVALVLRLVTLDRESLWLDEVASLQYAVKSVENILFTRSDPHPPLYYLLLHYWVALGQNEFILRLPSTMAGAASVLLLYWLVREWAGKWSAAASAWLLAVAPVHIWYSQEARMYAMLCALGLASTLFYSLAIRRASPAAWIAWEVMTVAGLYTGYSMLLVILAQIALFGPLWQFHSSSRKTLLGAVSAFLSALILFAPQARVFATQLVVQGENLWYYLSLRTWLSGWGVHVSTAQLHRTFLLAGLLVVGVIVAIVRGMPRRLGSLKPGKGLVLAITVFYILILVASAVPRGLGVKRQSLILFPYALSVVAIVLATQQRRLRLFLGLAIITLPVTGYVLVAKEQEDWRSVARLMEQNVSPRDIILISASYMQIPFDYYYRGSSERQGVGSTSVPTQLESFVALHERVWLILSNDLDGDPQGAVPAWFDSHMHLARAWSYSGVRIRLYERGAK